MDRVSYRIVLILGGGIGCGGCGGVEGWIGVFVVLGSIPTFKPSLGANYGLQAQADPPSGQITCRGGLPSIIPPF